MLIGIDASRANTSEKTGVEAYAFHIIEELKKIIPSHVRVVLYSREPLEGPISILPDNWSSKVLRWPPKKFWTQVRLSIEMLFHSPDVLFIPAHVPPLFHPKKTVMTVHDIAAVRFPNTYNWFERWYTIWSAKRAVQTLWRVIVPSAFTREELVKLCRHQNITILKHQHKDAFLHRGYDILSEEINKLFSHVFVVPHGYDSTQFAAHISDEKEKINRIKEKYGITKKYMMSIGRLEEKKNTWRIVAAFDRLRSDYPECDVQLVLAGKPGYGFTKVVRAINESEFRNDIIKTGWVDAADMPYLLAGAELFAFPSLYEGFGLPVLESMALGIPVIASRDNSLAEVGGNAVSYVDAFHVHGLEKKMHMILTQNEIRERMRDKGYAQAALFSWHTAAEKTASILFGTEM